MNKHCVQDQVDCHVIFQNLLWNSCSSWSFLKLDASVSQVMAEKADFICSVVIIVCRDAAPLSWLLFQSLLGLEMTCPLRPRGGSRLIQITLCASLTFFFCLLCFHCFIVLLTSNLSSGRNILQRLHRIPVCTCLFEHWLFFPNFI